MVIPTLNEAAVLPALLADLAAQSMTHRVIVADGGSSDATVRMAEAQGASVVVVPRGRGTQMNAGAARAESGWLLFLHADSRLTAVDQLARACARLAQARTQHGEAVAGHFALQFERSQPGHRHLFQFMEAKTASNRPGTINGDQGLLITRTYFERLDGFDTRWPFFEDQRIARRIFQTGRWVLLPEVLRTSARRFEQEGHRERYLLMALMMLMHEMGIERFFDQAPALYAEQADTRQLQLAPFLELARRQLVEACRVDPAMALRAGRYLRGNAWQLALMLDVARGPGLAPDSASNPRSSWLERFDRRLAPALDHGAADAAAALLLAGSLFVMPRLATRPWIERHKKRPA